MNNFISYLPMMCVRSKFNEFIIMSCCSYSNICSICIFRNNTYWNMSSTFWLTVFNISHWYMIPCFYSSIFIFSNYTIFSYPQLYFFAFSTSIPCFYYSEHFSSLSWYWIWISIWRWTICMTIRSCINKW